MFNRVRLRFGLATLLCAISVICVTLGYQTNQAKRQREAVAALCATGDCIVMYEYEFGEGANSGTEPGIPQWLLNAFGKDFFYDVKLVWVGNGHGCLLSPGPKWDGSSLRYLLDLPDVEHLVLCYTPVSDEAMDVLAQSSSLKHIDFAGVQFTGTLRTSPLAQMKQVRTLTFDNCVSLTAKDLSALHSLPIETLRISPLYVDSDLGASIGGFRHLQSLSLSHVPLSDEDLLAICKLRHLHELHLRQCRPEPMSTADARLIAAMFARQQHIRKLLPDKHQTLSSHYEPMRTKVELFK